MPEIYYEKITIITPDNPRRLEYIRKSGTSADPEPLRNLRRQIRNVERVVATFLEDELSARRDFFDQLHKTADTGCRGADLRIKDAEDNLQDIKEDLEEYGRTVRGVWLKRYTKFLWLCAASGLLGATIYFASLYGICLDSTKTTCLPMPDDKGKFGVLTALAIAAFWIPCGAVFGVWLEFVVRGEAGFTYEKLLLFDPGRWRPGHRILLAVGVSYAFAIVLGFGVVQVGVGPILLNKFLTTEPYDSILIGLTTGFSYGAVRDILLAIRTTRRGAESSATTTKD